MIIGSYWFCIYKLISYQIFIFLQYKPGLSQFFHALFDGLFASGHPKAALLKIVSDVASQAVKEAVEEDAKAAKATFQRGESPIAGWFIRENPKITWMI